ncbi:unnamed protein product [Pylaiella littoralis]
MARSIVVLLGLQLLQLHGRAALGQVVISVNRTAGQVEVASCEGLKKNAELGIDIDIIVTANLRCSETVTIPSGVDVTIGSEEDAQENWYIVIAEDFVVPDPTSATLLVNPKGSYLSLDRLSFSNDPGTAGSPGAVRAVRNEGTLDVSSCLFSGLNFASAQDGGAIYSTAEPGSGDGASVSVSNSSFIGNVAENHGGAIAAWGQGTVDMSNCSFVGNEVVGVGGYRRAGTGGAVYASPGVFVTVLNSTFEECLSLYGGAALFACGANIYDSTFDRNEATGLFGAVVNGDLSDEDRAEASLSLVATTTTASTAGGETQNYTCPPLYVSGSIFEGNLVTTGVGGAIASVDSSLSVFNSSLLDTVGGAIYFGTSDGSGRDQLDLDLLELNFNEGSDSSPSFVGSVLLLERTGSPASNTTGALEAVEASTSSFSSSTPSTATVAAAASVGSVGFVGVARDIYCFENDPYECEVYLGGESDDGDIALQFTGTVRCSACRGAAFTGIGSAAGAPTPAPFAVDDDDGLSKMGQERAQGGTPSPAAAGGGGSGSSSSSGAGARDGAVGAESEPELLGVTGGMRWVVVGLIAGIGGALLVCMCLVTVCRNKEKTRGSGGMGQRELVSGSSSGGGGAEESRVGGSAMAGPRAALSVTDEDLEQNGFGRSGSAGENVFFSTSSGTSAAVNVGAVVSSGTSTSRQLIGRERAGGSGGGGGGGGSRGRQSLFYSNSPGTSAAATVDAAVSTSRRPSGTVSTGTTSRRPSGTDSSRPSSRRASGRVSAGGGGWGGEGGDRDSRRDTTGSAVAVVNMPTPGSSELRARELARQRSIEMAHDWTSPPLVSAWGDEITVGGAGHVAVSQRGTPAKKGFAALDNDSAGEKQRQRRSSSRSKSRERSVAAGTNSHRDRASPYQSPPAGARNHSADAAAVAEPAPVMVVFPRGRPEISKSGSSVSSSMRPSTTYSEDGEAGGMEGGRQQQQRYPFRSRPQSQSRSRSRERLRSPGAPTAPVSALPLATSSKRAGGSGGGSGGSGSVGGSGSGSAGGKSSRNSVKKIKPPASTTPSKQRSRENSKERATGRAVARSVKTPAGGARLPISASTTPGSAVSPSRGRPRTAERSAAAAAAAASAVARVSTGLEETRDAGGGDGRGHKRADSGIISSGENPVYSHDRASGGGEERKPSRSLFKRSSQSPARVTGEVAEEGQGKRSRSRSRGDSGSERWESGRLGGWASELYRASPGTRKERSAQVYSGKFDSSRSDWSAEGEVEWARHTPKKPSETFFK